ncbi:MAG: hypothetical protein BGO98_08510 [Myxococcales bacterium 68-20]|nr:hypothetical protein [Myxococcales bacterium]OJY25037.1 MAG: hypothetical protein BGO98_08510 [Myxococcales bacterium 68-20]
MIGAWPKISALRTAVQHELARFDVAKVDKLLTYARAMTFAQTLYLGASGPSELLPQLVEKGIALRELLISEATPLAHRGLVDRKKLGELKRAVGYLNIGSDLGVLRERWDDIKSKTGLQPSELDTAEHLRRTSCRVPDLRARGEQEAQSPPGGQDRSDRE